MYRANAVAARLEVGAMTALLLSYIWLWKGTFSGDVFVCCSLYVALGLTSHLRRGESAREIGWRLDNLARATLQAMRFIGPIALLFVAMGLAFDTIHLPQMTQLPKAIVRGALWGTIQQYGLVAFYYRRFRELVPGSWLPMIAAASMFSLFHLPNPFLTTVTLFAGALACWLYRREPNLWALGLAHSLLSLSMSRSLPLEITFGHRVGPGFWSFLEKLQATTLPLP